MGDKTEQPGPREAAKRVIEPIEDDVEGHKRLVSLTGDEPGPSEAGKRFSESDEDDVEGHKK
jgi:hypothetical protein